MSVGLPFIPASDAVSSGLVAAVGRPRGCAQVPSCDPSPGLAGLIGGGTTPLTRFDCTTHRNRRGRCGVFSDNISVPTVVASIHWGTTSTNLDPFFNIALSRGFEDALPACVAIQYNDKTYSYQFNQGSARCHISGFHELGRVDAASVYLTIPSSGGSFQPFIA